MDASTIAELSLDLATLRAAYAEGAFTPSELIEQVYERIARGDHPNVWIHLAPKADLLARARELGPFDPAKASPLWGIPFGVKDNIDVAGMPTTAACPDYAYNPKRSALTVERLLAGGALCIGKTNMDQFATGLVGTRSPAARAPARQWLLQAVTSAFRSAPTPQARAACPQRSATSWA
jgi:allophanate hydrolase